MLNATRAQLYRMLHGSLLWVCLAIIVLPIAAAVAAVAAALCLAVARRRDLS